MAGDILYLGDAAAGIQCFAARDADKYPTMQRTGPQNKYYE